MYKIICGKKKNKNESDVFDEEQHAVINLNNKYYILKNAFIIALYTTI